MTVSPADGFRLRAVVFDSLRLVGHDLSSVGRVAELADAPALNTGSVVGSIPTSPTIPRVSCR